MTVRIAYDNLARRAELPAQAAAGSVGAGTPPGRLLTDALSECWRSAPGVNATWIGLELRESAALDTVALVGTNLSPLATWRIRVGVDSLSAPTTAAYDSGIIGAGVVEPWGLALHYLPATVAGQRVRIDLEDPTVEALEVPRWWLAKSWVPPYGFKYGHEERLIDLSSRTRSDYGATFVDRRPILRGYSLEFGTLTDADRQELRTLARLCGSSSELLVCLDDQSDQLGADALLALPSAHPVTSVAPGLWAWTLELEEVI